MSELKPRRNAPLFEAAGRGFTGLALGFGALTTTALSSLPNLLGTQPHVAAIYAAAIPKSAGAAISAAIAAVALSATAHELKNCGDTDTPPRKWDINPPAVLFLVGFVPFIFNLGGLVGLALKLSQAVGL